jgi:hypothetical protein
MVFCAALALTWVSWKIFVTTQRSTCNITVAMPGSKDSQEESESVPLLAPPKKIYS